MEWKLWSTASIVALLKAQMDFFLGGGRQGTKRNRTFETQGFDSIEIKFSTIYHPPVQV